MSGCDVFKELSIDQHSNIQGMDTATAQHGKSFVVAFGMGDTKHRASAIGVLHLVPSLASVPNCTEQDLQQDNAERASTL